MNKNDSCVICFEYKYKITLPCQHMICICCYQKLLEYNITTCPLCRHPIELELESISTYPNDSKEPDIQDSQLLESDSLQLYNYSNGSVQEEAQAQYQDQTQHLNLRYILSRLCCSSIILFSGIYILVAFISK